MAEFVKGKKTHFFQIFEMDFSHFEIYEEALIETIRGGTF